MSLHLVAEDHSEDPLEPVACDACGGTRVLPVVDLSVGGYYRVIRTSRCFVCCCEVCGDTTETAPLCARCDIAQDAAYERRQDV